MFYDPDLEAVPPFFKTHLETPLGGPVYTRPAKSLPPTRGSRCSRPACRGRPPGRGGRDLGEDGARDREPTPRLAHPAPQGRRSKPFCTNHPLVFPAATSETPRPARPSGRRGLPRLLPAAPCSAS